MCLFFWACRAGRDHIDAGRHRKNHSHKPSFSPQNGYRLGVPGMERMVCLFGCFPKIGRFYPQNGWWKFHGKPYFLMDDLGVPLFLETPIWRWWKSFMKNNCDSNMQKSNQIWRIYQFEQCNNNTMILQYMRSSMISSSHTLQNVADPCSRCWSATIANPWMLKGTRYSRRATVVRWLFLQCARTSPSRAHSRTPSWKALKQSPIHDMQMLCSSPFIDAREALSVSGVTFLVQNYLLMFSCNTLWYTMI